MIEIIDDTTVKINGKVRRALNHLKLAAMYRDDYTCQDCGIRTTGYIRRGSPRLHVHHIKPVKLGGEHRLSNLITLCAGCHKRRHSNETLARIPPAERRSVPIDVCIYLSALSAAQALTVSIVELIESAIIEKIERQNQEPA